MKANRQEVCEGIRNGSLPETGRFYIRGPDQQMSLFRCMIGKEIRTVTFQSTHEYWAINLPHALHTVEVDLIIQTIKNASNELQISDARF